MVLLRIKHMHHKDLLIIRLGVAVASVAQKHRLSPRELLDNLRQLFPGLELRVLERAAAIGAARAAG
jgi:hypothetical protein